MPDLIASPPASSPVTAAGARRAAPDTIREYVGDLAGQLAVMARASGDDALAKALEAAADLAVAPPAHPGVVRPAHEHHV